MIVPIEPVRRTSAERARVLIRAQLDVEHVSQADLARYLGITPKHLSGMLLGRAGISLDMLDRIAEALGQVVWMTFAYTPTERDVTS